MSTKWVTKFIFLRQFSRMAKTKKIDAELAKLLGNVNSAEEFVVDTTGRTKKNECGVMRTLRVQSEQRKRIDSRDLKTARRREAEIQRIQESKNHIADLWGEAIQSDLPNPIRPPTRFPAVATPSAGESVNPDLDCWKQDLLHIQAIYSAANAQTTEIACFKPVTDALTKIFPANSIMALTDDQVYKLFALVRRSETVPEDPENFLARILPHLDAPLKNEDANIIEDIKEHIELSTDGETDNEMQRRRKKNKPRRKSRKALRNDSKQRLVVQQSKINRGIKNLDYVLARMDVAAQRRSLRQNHKQALAESLVANETHNPGGLIVGYDAQTAGVVSFLDIPKRVASSAALKASKRGFRLSQVRLVIYYKFSSQAQNNTLLSDRLGSYLRRHVIDIGSANLSKSRTKSH